MAEHALEKALLPKAREPFADGRAAHAVLARERHFRQRRPRTVAPFDDPRLQIAVRAFNVWAVERQTRVTRAGLSHDRSSALMLPAQYTAWIRRASGFRLQASSARVGLGRRISDVGSRTSDLGPSSDNRPPSSRLVLSSTSLSQQAPAKPFQNTTRGENDSCASVRLRLLSACLPAFAPHHPPPRSTSRARSGPIARRARLITWNSGDRSGIRRPRFPSRANRSESQATRSTSSTISESRRRTSSS